MRSQTAREQETQKPTQKRLIVNVDLTTVTKHGLVIRDGNRTLILVKKDMSHLLGKDPDVSCLNPDAPKAKRVYQKVFNQRKIYLPEEYDLAVSEQLNGRYVLVLAMNGYSSIKPDQCAAWGIREGAYEVACKNLLKAVCRHLQAQFPDIDIRLAHGSSDMGVDRAIIDAANELRRPMLGFSCAEYAFYVKDGTDFPMHIAATVDEYSEGFVRSADVLIAANGRKQAFRMDIRAVFEYDKVLIPVNVIRLISTLGGPPAKSPDGTILDAVAHFEQRMCMIGQRRPTAPGSIAHDPWKSAIHELGEFLVDRCRHVLDPEVGLEVRI